jgi:hypothetical protein
MISVLLWFGVALASPNWTELGPQIESGDLSAVIVKVQNSNPNQAPMLQMTVDGVIHEVPCADDGSFPDMTPDDDVFHCAAKVSMGLVERGEWTAAFSMRGGDGEAQPLGTVVYPKGGGYRYATLTIGSPGVATSTKFDLPETVQRARGSPPAQTEEASVQAPPEAVPQIPPEAVPQPPPEAVPPPSPEAAAPHKVVVMPPSVGPGWSWVVGALIFGWAIGRRTRDSSTETRDAVRSRPCTAIDGSGPVPDAAVTVHATDRSAAVASVWTSLTGIRRLVLVGEPVGEVPPSGHEVLHCQDPDPTAIAAVLQGLHNDGGVPPVLFVFGRTAVLDTSGSSGEPVADLVAAVGSRTWVAVFAGNSEDSVPGTESWSHDPQAGWSRF